MVHIGVMLPNWNSLESVRNAHSLLEGWALIFFAILVVFDVLAHLYEDDKDTAKLFERIGLCCFGIAILAEIVAYPYSRRNDLLSDQENAVQRYKIAILENSTQKLRTDADIASKQAEGEKLARVKLEKQIQPRTINQSDREKLGEELKKFAAALKGRKVKMSSQIGDAEGMVFSLEIVDILTRAGIAIEDVGLGRVEGVGRVIMGANVTGPLADEEFIRSLAQGLTTHANSAVNGESKATYPDIAIMVGVKPIVGLPRN
jgi:hypothetical protein